ncbi:MAG: helix-turn-helix domain-containing protein [Thermosipho sp. (in: Bacteria)]|nr:helix-turn-helix domain-containing protein [Thermosipho sp. (in: thermotogales)]
MKNKIKVLRAEHEITLEKLSRALGMSIKTLSFIENRKVEPTVASMRKIAGFFGKKVEEVFDINNMW